MLAAIATVVTFVGTVLVLALRASRPHSPPEPPVVLYVTRPHLASSLAIPYDEHVRELGRAWQGVAGEFALFEGGAHDHPGVWSRARTRDALARVGDSPERRLTD